MIIDDYFPEKGKLVLTATGKEFIEKLGLETAKKVILGVLQGENIRTQTEPLTRRRVAIATGAMISLFLNGWVNTDDFSENISRLALEQLDNTPQSNKEKMWPAQWLIGLTGKSYQNVLRSNPKLRQSYIEDFDKAIEEAAIRCQEDYGDIKFNFGYLINDEYKGSKRELNWKDITYLSSAIGSATLTIRGSEKSTYGKLFERLIMGTVLSILDFEYIENSLVKKLQNVYWLSDSSDIRECDATIRLRPGKLIRFDIGFIGRGNPEIMKDKLSRYANEIEQNGISNYSKTFIIVDKMPKTTRTNDAAIKAGTEIIQMSMQYWAVDLARKLDENFGYHAQILDIPEDDIHSFIERKLSDIDILQFLNFSTSVKKQLRERADSNQTYL